VPCDMCVLSVRQLLQVCKLLTGADDPTKRTNKSLKNYRYRESESPRPEPEPWPLQIGPLKFEDWSVHKNELRFPKAAAAAY
jgi:hypothetical protein